MQLTDPRTYWLPQHGGTDCWCRPWVAHEVPGVGRVWVHRALPAWPDTQPRAFHRVTEGPPA